MRPVSSLPWAAHDQPLHRILRTERPPLARRSTHALSAVRGGGHRSQSALAARPHHLAVDQTVTLKIAVDFDGTCVDHRYPDVGPDVPGAADALTALHRLGALLILNTMRSGKELVDAERWFAAHGIPLFGSGRDPEQDSWTSSPKCYANIYIDDAAYGAPLMSLAKFRRPCVDWTNVVEHISKEFGL